MVIIMDMETGMPESGIQATAQATAADSLAYDDEVLNAGWTEVPRIEPRLEQVESVRHEPGERDVEGFLARLYAAQE